jgi:hypothetical protein
MNLLALSINLKRMKKLITTILSSQIAILFYLLGFLPAQVFAVPNWTQQIPSTTPPARLDFGMSFNSNNNSVIIFGGDNGNNSTNDTWEFDGTAWSEISTAIPPLLELLLA